VLGLQGMPRRIQTYADGYGFNFWNFVATIGAFLIALSMLVFFYNIAKSKRDAPNLPPPGPDPWDARTLEWMVPSPTPHHNFDSSPVVTELDDFWHRKYAEDEHGRVTRIATGEEIAQDGSGHPHLPSPSYFPLILALGLPFIAYGLIFNLGISFFGGLLVLIGFVGWGLEPQDDPEASAHGGDDDDSSDEATAPAEAEEVSA
jgi:cytochrome c oxidase subunit 1